MVEESVLTLPGSANKADLAQGSIFFVGTATTVIRYGGFTILTDPNFLHAGDHVHLGYGITSERLTNPAVEIDELPSLDLCILSHLHEDHWDDIATERLPKSLPIVTTRHAANALGQKGFTALQPLETWQTLRISKDKVWLRITSMPGRHGPSVLSMLLPPVMGSMLEWGTGSNVHLRLYISGDTLVYNQLKEIPQRYPDIDLALLHLGGTKVLGVLLTMNAKQGIRMIQLVRPRMAIPIHYNDYTVFKSPLDAFMSAVEEAQIETKVHYLNHGDTYTFKVSIEA